MSRKRRIVDPSSKLQVVQMIKEQYYAGLP
ncbi:hypothetical protein WP8S17C03_43880 [Metapseudomonas otitidis]|uniref:Uncharacterized protein n=1 Tax=Metapseudomonas otitidis TaxID=319939 RepID=A0A6S5S1Q4_9GAMM|nr:hypothetical protein WP8S17C03_43880 [Pseudomonas otitidis]